MAELLPTLRKRPPARNPDEGRLASRPAGVSSVARITEQLPVGSREPLQCRPMAGSQHLSLTASFYDNWDKELILPLFQDCQIPIGR